MSERTIYIPVHNIVIVLTDENISHEIVDTYYKNTSKFGGGSITSELRKPCPDCGDTGCYGHCENGTELEDDWYNRADFNKLMDAIESLILAQAKAGVDVESPAYLEALESVLQDRE